jgi:putative Ca2+/H+ antiporter (TMEM165/GDT1 family)
MHHLLPIFVTIMLAELGDKTQLATLLFAADKQHHPVMVFMAAALALVASTAIAVALGTIGERYLTMVPLKLLAGIGFVAIGAWSIWEHLSGA